MQKERKNIYKLLNSTCGLDKCILTKIFPAKGYDWINIFS